MAMMEAIFVFFELREKMKSKLMISASFFLTSLKQNKNYAQRVVSWFNELETEKVC